MAMQFNGISEDRSQLEFKDEIGDGLFTVRTMSLPSVVIAMTIYARECKTTEQMSLEQKIAPPSRTASTSARDHSQALAAFVAQCEKIEKHNDDVVQRRAIYPDRYLSGMEMLEGLSQYELTVGTLPEGIKESLGYRYFTSELQIQQDTAEHSESAGHATLPVIRKRSASGPGL